GAEVEIDDRINMWNNFQGVWERSTDADGVARWEGRDLMCCGTRSGLGFTDTFVVNLPHLCFRVAAAGYQTSEWVDLDVPEYIRQVEGRRSGKAKLVVRVLLQKLPAALRMKR